MWRRDSASRPSRVYATSESIAREFDVIFDAMFLVADEVGSGRLPSSAFEKSERVNDWAVCRAHWLAGQYVLLHGRSPEELVAPPTSAELNRDLDRELEHLERHVYEGDAADQFEATYTIFNGCQILRTDRDRQRGHLQALGGGLGTRESAECAGTRPSGPPVARYDGAATAEDNETCATQCLPSSHGPTAHAGEAATVRTATLVVNDNEAESMWQIRELAPNEVERVCAVLGLARLGQGDGYYLVAWEDDEPVGHAHLALTDPPELQDVSVRPEYRRRGVATALASAAEHAVVGRGGDRLRLSVSIDNAAALALYRGLGYADVGIPPRRVHGTIQIRTGPLEVDDTLLTWEKSLDGRNETVDQKNLDIYGDPPIPWSRAERQLEAAVDRMESHFFSRPSGPTGGRTSRGSRPCGSTASSTS